MFEFTRYDLHEKQTTNEDGELINVPIDTEWKRFKTCIDPKHVKIIAFMEYVIFDKDENPTPCVKIVFEDGGYYYTPHSLELFKKKYIEEYLPLTHTDN